MDVCRLSTHSPEEISKLEQDTGLRFSGYLHMGGEQDTLIPVLLRPGHTQDEARARILKLNRMEA